MIKHVMLVNFKAEIGKKQQDEFAAKVLETLSQIPGTRNVTVGRAFEIEGKTRYSAALFIDFDNEAGLKSYFEHPKHDAVAANLPSMLSEFLVANYVC